MQYSPFWHAQRLIESLLPLGDKVTYSENSFACNFQQFNKNSQVPPWCPVFSEELCRCQLSSKIESFADHVMLEIGMGTKYL